MKKLVILSPSRYSLFTTTVAEMLLKRDIEISAFIVRRLLNPYRFRTEFKNDGSRLIKKIWQKLVLRKKLVDSNINGSIVDLRREEGLKYRVVDDFYKYLDIPIYYCNTLNDSITHSKLSSIKPDLVVFTGGGIIRKKTLELAGRRVLNCHMGILPYYRGMDVIDWAILEQCWSKVGVTVHFMNIGLDTGNILAIRRIPKKKNETIIELYKRFDTIMCDLMVDAVVKYLSGAINPKSQQIKDGKQYYVMHPRLLNLVQRLSECK